MMNIKIVNMQRMTFGAFIFYWGLLSEIRKVGRKIDKCVLKKHYKRKEIKRKERAARAEK